MEIPQWLQPLVTTLAARMVVVILTLAVPTLFGVYIKDRQKFAGRWELVIAWSKAHATHLFGKEMPEPHSCGRLAISYGSGPESKGYWGLAYFELLSGTKIYARLCVELEEMVVTRRWFSRSFPYLLRVELNELTLRSLIREKDIEFEYGPWSRYRMKFESSSGHTLKGRMVLIDTGTTVGRITAIRTG